MPTEKYIPVPLVKKGEINFDHLGIAGETQELDKIRAVLRKIVHERIEEAIQIYGVEPTDYERARINRNILHLRIFQHESDYDEFRANIRKKYRRNQKPAFLTLAKNVLKTNDKTKSGFSFPVWDSEMGFSIPCIVIVDKDESTLLHKLSHAADEILEDYYFYLDNLSEKTGKMRGFQKEQQKERRVRKNLKLRRKILDLMSNAIAISSALLLLTEKVSLHEDCVILIMAMTAIAICKVFSFLEYDRIPSEERARKTQKRIEKST